MVGKADPGMEALCAANLARPDVHRLDYTDDVGAVYRAADLLALPSLHEGSPLVVYEAMACGLPIVTTPMGAGAIVRDGIEGFVLDPYDVRGWGERLRLLTSDVGLRLRMGRAARERVQDFTWQAVGARRRALLLAL
jgi:glycosyltransferase involved in cell wall biosynthesis